MTPDRLETVRRIMRLTQADLGRLVDVSERTVRAWEKGTSPVPVAVSLILRLLIVAEARTRKAILAECKLDKPDQIIYQRK